MMNLKSKKGITLIALVITIIVITILSVGITTSITSTLELKSFYAIKEDILSLSEETQQYYLNNNGKLPIADNASPVSFNVDAKYKNPNDNDNYYDIDISKLPKAMLKNDVSMYLINEQSLTIYCKQGYVLNGKRQYTIVDSSVFYDKVNLPIISLVTFESNGIDKNHATAGDTITLKMLKNYDFTTAPTITINGQAVTATWNGNIGIATYIMPRDLSKNGQIIQFTISNYSADGRVGDIITQPTFTNGILYYI